MPTSPRCPDMTVEALERYDFAAEMKVQPPVSAKLRAGVEAALVVNRLAEDVDRGLKQACGAFLADVGAKADLGASSDPCGALVQAIAAARARLGANAAVVVDVVPPSCGAALEVVSECAARCDPTLAGPPSRASCEAGELQGTCDALCTGSCDAASPGACRGQCSGRCDGKGKGTCSGACNGKCDGKPTKKGGAVCAGVCDGTCDGAVLGSCAGACSGRCALIAAAPCAGTCSGACSADMKAAICTGDITPPRLGDECRARCDAQLAASLSCAQGPVLVRVTGATDPAAALAFRSAAEKHLPVIDRTAIGLAERAPGVLAEVRETVDAVQAAVLAALSDPVAARQVNGCFAKLFADVATAGASLQGNIDLAVAVKASLASGGPGAGATFVAPRATTPVKAPAPPLRAPAASAR